MNKSSTPTIPLDWTEEEEEAWHEIETKTS